MLELGKESIKEHRAAIKLLKELGFRNVILTGEIFNSLEVPSTWKQFPDVLYLKDWLENNDIKAG